MQQRWGARFIPSPVRTGPVVPSSLHQESPGGALSAQTAPVRPHTHAHSCAQTSALLQHQIPTHLLVPNKPTSPSRCTAQPLHRESMQQHLQKPPDPCPPPSPPKHHGLQAQQAPRGRVWQDPTGIVTCPAAPNLLPAPLVREALPGLRRVFVLCYWLTLFALRVRADGLSSPR